MMNQSFRKHIEDLRAALLKLSPTGEEGFEGLIAVVLTEISGIPFRLAGSGSQFGVDAKPAYESDSVCFEGKRYDGQIPRTEVLSKIAQLSIKDEGDIDLWVLCATSQVTSQLADDVRKLGQESGISTLVLDWTSTGIPPLAAALAMSETMATEFLESHLNEKGLASKAATALKEIGESDGFAQHAERIRSLLHEPTLGIGIARQANVEWLTKVFSSKQQAKRFLGQPLSPRDISSGSPLTRDGLINRMRPFLASKPDDRIVIVLGGEGNGKSWLVAQSWLSLAEKPVMIVLTPEDFVGATPAADLEEILVHKLVEQTSDHLSAEVSKRWRRKLARWRNEDAPNTPRLVVFIDGLNQRPQTDWARIMDAMVSEVGQIGGRLIVTARTTYFRDLIKRRLISPVVEVQVPEWTESERDKILAANGIEGSDLRASVAASLRNPRLLGIALGLLQNAQIKDLDELSVSRLLFEHMRVNEQDAPSPQPAYEFARKLQDHAKEILSRVTSQQLDDLKVFDGGLEAVSDGRFFIPVEGDATRYTLREDGLTLALGFSVLDQLRSALRNGRDLETTLDAIIEPISALDRTPKVIVAALTVSCVDEDYPLDIAAANVGAFAEIQNPNPDDFNAFAALARERPEAFMKAAHRLCLAGAHQLNFDWIEAALHAAKTDDQAWSAMSDNLRTWLGYYALSPERGMFSHPSRDIAEKVEKERTKKEKEIDERLRSLSPAERDLLNSLTRRDDGNLSTLARFVLTLMAGKPIAPFAAGLAQWSFANALNPDHVAAPYKEFTHLVRFNRVDWSDARKAILRECGVFEGPDVSRTGKWALVNMLRATGHAEEGARVDTLVAELTADRPRLEGWRLVEKYCASDPCDPNSKSTGNIRGTAKDYAAIDVSKIRLSISSSAEDHFFSMACLGVARFEPNVAIDKHREFIAQVLGRAGYPLRQGLFELRRDNALLARDDAFHLIGAGTADGNDGALREQDRWIVSQYRQLLAFPHLSGKEQIETMLSQDADNGILLELMDVANPLDEGTFESLLEKACRENDECSQFRILAFGGSTDTAISENARKHLAALVRSDSERVRAQALGLIASLGDAHLIDVVVQSGWSTSQLDRDDGYEAWYGSAVILEAAARGIIPHNEALDRMAPQLYGRAAKKLNANALSEVSRRIDASIKRAANLTMDRAVPDIELPVRSGGGAEPALYIASEKPTGSDDPFDALKRFSERPDAFEARQKRLNDAFEAFKAELTQANARIILDYLRTEEFDVIAASDKDLAESWYELFINLPKSRLAAVHNLGLLLAHALAVWSPDKAAHLFTVLSNGQPFVRVTFGHAGVMLDGMAVWSAADDPTINALRFDRLDKTGNDHELALEVLAALWNGKEALLRAYIEKQLKTEEPAEIARALMVVGLSEHNEFNDEILASYQDSSGFIGRAQAAAMYAYERNIWAEHWFREMCKTERPHDFWRYSALFIKIVDGRFCVWQSVNREWNVPFHMFWPSIESKLQHRFKKWRDHRQNKLFGDDAPPEAFRRH